MGFLGHGCFSIAWFWGLVCSVGAVVFVCYTVALRLCRYSVAMSLIVLYFSEADDTLTDAQVAQVQAAAPDMRVELLHSPDALREVLPDVEILAGGAPSEMIVQAPSLRWYQQWSAGSDWLLKYPQARSMPFLLTTASGVHAIPISEHIFAFLLSLGRHFHHAARLQAKKAWREGYAASDMFELEGKTMLILGVGAIGARTAQLAEAFGMRVIGVRNNASKSVPHVARMVSVDALDAVLPEADVVVSTVPLTEDTRHMLGRAQFERMKETAFFINIGRGKTVDEAALIQALTSGQIAAAGLDVFEDEPLAKESPLWEMDNVIITPHVSGMTPQYNARALDIFLENLRRFQQGETLKNLVDKERAY